MVLAAFGGVLLALAPRAVIAQAPAVDAETFTAPRTPWGDPDLQGIWSTGYIEVSLERPDEYGDREFLSEEEVLGGRSGRELRSTGPLDSGCCRRARSSAWSCQDRLSQFRPEW